MFASFKTKENKFGYSLSSPFSIISVHNQFSLWYLLGSVDISPDEEFSFDLDSAESKS